MQLLGRESTSFGMIGHRRNHYAKDADANNHWNIYIYNRS